jgi:hypothetical protein
MSGEAGPSGPPAPPLNLLARQISGLDDAALRELGEQLTPETRKRLRDNLASSGQTPPSDRKGKRSLFNPKPAPPKTLRELYVLLRDMHKVHEIAWIQDLRGFVTCMSEERGNISTCRDSKDPYKCWEDPPDEEASTVKCLAPKREGKDIRKPSTAKPKAAGMKTEGYVYYQIPAWVKDTCGNKNIAVPFSKIVLHKLVLLADLVLKDKEADEIPTNMECSHLCGNPWCCLHVVLETSSVNQDRGPCFDLANEKKFACTGHGTDPVLYCIRSREASSRVPGLLVDGKDQRAEVVVEIARTWWNQRNDESGKNAVRFYSGVRKVGGKGAAGHQIAAGFHAAAKIIGTPLKTLMQRKRRP